MPFWTFTQCYPFLPVYTFFCSFPPWTPALWCRPLSWGDGRPGFCLSTVECRMRGRSPGDEDACLYNKWKLVFEVHSLLQVTLPPTSVDDEGGAYKALALISLVTELSTAATRELFDFVLS